MGKETSLDRFDVSGDINAISNLNFEEITDRALGENRQGKLTMGRTHDWLSL
jgi:hypothetical protein